MFRRPEEQPAEEPAAKEPIIERRRVWSVKLWANSRFHDTGTDAELTETRTGDVGLLLHSYSSHASVFLNDKQTRELRDFLNQTLAEAAAPDLC
jgi:hypothetical protein